MNNRNDSHLPARRFGLWPELIPAAAQGCTGMTPKWIIPGALVVAAGSLSLLAYLLLSSPTGSPVGKEELMAEIVRNWQAAHPAENRFEVLPAFQHEAVLDKETGLIWELAPDSTRVTWNEARATCIRRVIGGQKGWRLPSPAEMRSLVGPAIDAPGPNIPPGHPFLNIVQSSYWTVVPEANQPSYARYLDAFLGNVLSMTRIYTFPVWCVRGPIATGPPVGG